jgi:zinc/manganese transport system substrate-binding protein
MMRSIWLASAFLLTVCGPNATPVPSVPLAAASPSASVTITPTTPAPTVAAAPTASATAAASPSATASASAAVTPSPSANASASPSASPSATSAPQAGPNAPVDSGPPLTVIGTENFYGDLLIQIGGPRVRSFSPISDPNADPHQFEANPSTAALVADADLIIENGLGYDDFMDKLIGASPRARRIVINVQQLLGYPVDVNVHVWYDPATMPQVAEAATRALTTLDPANAPYFAARKASYLAAFGPVNAEIARIRARYAGTPVAFTENVAGYLTKALGLPVLTPVGFMRAIEQGVDPAPADVAAERDLMTQKKVKVLMYNSQVTSPITRAIYSLAQQNGIPVIGVAETIPPGFATFQEWQLAQLTALEQALAQAR